MTSSVDSHEGKVSMVLDLSNLATTVTVINAQVLHLCLLECLVTWPLKRLSPSLVSKPVANEVGITGINQDWDLLQNAWNESVERFHPIALEEEVSVDVKVA